MNPETSRPGRKRVLQPLSTQAVSSLCQTLGWRLKDEMGRKLRTKEEKWLFVSLFCFLLF